MGTKRGVCYYCKLPSNSLQEYETRKPIPDWETGGFRKTSKLACPQCYKRKCGGVGAPSEVVSYCPNSSNLLTVWEGGPEGGLMLRGNPNQNIWYCSEKCRDIAKTALEREAAANAATNKAATGPPKAAVPVPKP